MLETASEKTKLNFLSLQSESPGLKKSVSQLSLSTPNSNRKRRRLKETLAQLTRETDMSPFPPRKRPSAEHSLSLGSLLDISNTPESSTTNGGIVKDLHLGALAVFKISLHTSDNGNDEEVFQDLLQVSRVIPDFFLEVCGMQGQSEAFRYRGQAASFHHSKHIQQYLQRSYWYS